MRRNWVIVFALTLVVWLVPTQLRAQDSSTEKTSNGELYTPGHGVKPPRRISGSEPEYDDKSRKAKTSGTVVLALIVTKDGRAADVKVVKSLTPRLDEQAIKAVSTWRFEPATKDGEPVAVHISVETTFRIR
jgi:TonB family protein